MTDTPVQRSDAQRNRERILAIALEELSSGSTLSLSAVAKRAGVGQGTMYRHFPDKDSLVLAVYHREVQQLVESAPQLLIAHPAPAALREWLSRLAKFAVTKAGFSDAMQQASRATGTPQHPGHAPVVEALTSLLAANHAAGTIRADLTIDDLLLVIAGVWQLSSHPDWQSRAARLFDLIMVGLTADAPNRG